MAVSVTVNYRNVDSTEWIEQLIQENAEKLGRFNEDLRSCRATLSAPHHHHHKGFRYHLALELNIDGKIFAVTRNAEDDRGHEDVHVAIRDAFVSAQHLLESRAKPSARRADARREKEIEVLRSTDTDALSELSKGDQSA